MDEQKEKTADVKIESKESFFKETLKFIVIAAVVVIPIRLFVAQPFIVSGESMDKTFAGISILSAREKSTILDLRMAPPP